MTLAHLSDIMKKHQPIRSSKGMYALVLERSISKIKKWRSKGINTDTKIRFSTAMLYPRFTIAMIHGKKIEQKLASVQPRCFTQISKHQMGRIHVTDHVTDHATLGGFVVVIGAR